MALGNLLGTEGRFSRHRRGRGGGWRAILLSMLAAALLSAPAGQAMAQAGPRHGQSWVDWLKEQRGNVGGNGEGGYQPDRNRNLPQEDRQKEHDQGRG